MAMVGVRDLRNHTKDLVVRAENGETIVVTINGRPAAELVALSGRPQWMARDLFVDRVLAHRGDRAMLTDIAALVGDETTDDLEL